MGAKWLAIAVCIDQDYVFLSGYAANSSDGNVGNLRRHVSSGASREQQLVVFPAVKSIFERYERTRPPDLGARDGRSRNLGAHSGFFTDVGEIG